MIDAHCHVGPGLRASAPFGPVAQSETAEELVRLLDSAGISQALIFAPRWNGGWGDEAFIDPNYIRANAYVAEAVAAFPDRLIGLGRVNPKFGAEAAGELRRCLDDYGFRGLKLDNEADGFDPTDLRLLHPLAELCAERNAIILTHTGYHPSQPLVFLPIANAYPQTPVILGHMGGRIVADAIIAAQHAPNILLETSGSMPMYIGRALASLGATRLVFGSDTPNNALTVEVERLRRLNLSREDWNLVTRQNIASALGLDIPEPPVE